MIRIHSNGSKWYREKPDTVKKLLAVLAEEPLDPSFEGYGDFILTTPGDKVVRFFGNFARLSHVFNIDTDDPTTIRALSLAIRSNQRSPAYIESRKGYGLCETCKKMSRFCQCEPVVIESLASATL